MLRQPRILASQLFSAMCHVPCASTALDNTEPTLWPRRTFYDRLREVHDYHRRYPSLDVTEVRSAGCYAP